MSAPLGAHIGGVAPPALKEELGRWSRALLLAFGGPYRHTFGQPRYIFYPSIVSYRYLLITVSYIFATLVLGSYSRLCGPSSVAQPHLQAAQALAPSHPLRAPARRGHLARLQRPAAAHPHLAPPRVHAVRDVRPPDIFRTWDEHIKEFTNVAREVTRKRSEREDRRAQVEGA